MKAASVVTEALSFPPRKKVPGGSRPGTFLLGGNLYGVFGRVRERRPFDGYVFCNSTKLSGAVSSEPVGPLDVEKHRLVIPLEDDVECVDDFAVPLAALGDQG
jgi:hypothetical protein